MLILLQHCETLIMAAFPGSSLKVKVYFDVVLLSGGAGPFIRCSEVISVPTCWREFL